MIGMKVALVWLIDVEPPLDAPKDLRRLGGRYVHATRDAAHQHAEEMAKALGAKSHRDVPVEAGTMREYGIRLPSQFHPDKTYITRWVVVYPKELLP